MQVDTKVRTLRQGFALLLTLSVLVIVIALTSVLINYLDDARQDAVESETLVQANLYYADIKGFLEKFKNSKKDLYSVLYQGPVPLALEEDEPPLLIACRPMYNRVNINWLGYANDRLMFSRYNIAKKVFDTIVQRYDIADPVLLEEMIASAANGVWGDSVHGRLRQSHGIVSFAIFSHILTQYAFRAEDSRALTIPWDRFFTFHAVSKGKQKPLEGNYLTLELLSVIFGQDEAVLKEEWVEGEGEFRRLSSLYGIHYDPALFSEKFLNASRCEVYFEHKGRRFGFAFTDIEGEVKSFEFFGEE